MLTGLQNAKFSESRVVYAHVCLKVLASISVFLLLIAVLIFLPPAQASSTEASFSVLQRYNAVK